MRHWILPHEQEITPALWGEFMIRLLSLPFVVFLLTACQAENKNLGLQQVDIIDAFASNAQTERQLSLWKVNCVDPKNCPDSVGQLLVTDGRTLGACTATLISSDTILTNSHCFDLRNPQTRELIDPNLICRSGTRIVFASQSASGHEQIKCKKILTKSFLGGTPNILYPDYAVIQLEKATTRSFDPITRLGIENEMQLTMRKVNPIRTGLGELEVKQCSAQFQTLLTPMATTPHYHVHLVVGCETQLGNSGSSVVDDAGKIRGVLYQGIGTSSRAPRTSFERQVLNQAVQDKVSFVANTTCMNHSFPGVPRRDEKLCIQYMTQAFKISDSLDADKIKSSFLQTVIDESETLVADNSFGYRVQFEPKTRGFYLAPFCVKLSEPTFYGADYPISIEAAISVWMPNIKVTTRMKPEVKDLNRFERFCNITLSYEEFYRRKKGSVQLSGSSCIDSQGQQKQGFDVWEVCKP